MSEDGMETHFVIGGFWGQKFAVVTPGFFWAFPSWAKTADLLERSKRSKSASLIWKKNYPER